MYQDLGQISSIPFRNEFKVQTNVPVFWKFEVSTSLYSDPVYNANFTTNLGSTYTPGYRRRAHVGPQPAHATLAV